MLNRKSVYKYETPYNGLYEITQYWNNGKVAFQIGATQIWYNIRHMKPNKSKKNVYNVHP